MSIARSTPVRQDGVSVGGSVPTRHGRDEREDQDDKRIAAGCGKTGVEAGRKPPYGPEGTHLPKTAGTHRGNHHQHEQRNAHYLTKIPPSH